MPRIATVALLAVSAITILWAPTTSGFWTGSQGRVAWDHNCDFYGHDYRSMKAIPAVCGDVCANDAACTHWSWNNYKGGTCWFKTGDRSTKIAKWGTNCGYVLGRSVQGQEGKGQAGKTNSGLSPSEMGEMLGRINAYRSQHGLAALTIDNQLVSAALLHSQDQANNCRMTHGGSNGSKVGDRISAQGYQFATAAENVAAGQETVDNVMTSWWNSPGHRANLLNKDVKNVGFGKAVNTNCNSFSTYWTQDFGRQD
ncbi:unnamed protein product [Peronospora farinosa]|uniref:SCP domain-containing protein n=1 Tax=Peronospora farinosa TaxID=134698 RepID=A0AAV0TFU5_9STRA|nr:unnamed protein product [Peronospora farinosa]CAI5720388.1 unnamed protein product [Peronospora farinosa]